uniref:V-SNARE coiled-coil homology domain-containing protein n=1 Tax=Globodera rostochiensis TaxID=31243 RepID=A0A914I837_GLORO
MDSPSAIASAEGGVQRQQNNGHLDQVQQQVNEVRTVMAQNVNRVLERGERLEHLDNRSQALQESSQSFTHTSHRVQRFMCMQSMKWTIIFGVFLSVMLLLGVLTLLRIFKVI